MIKKQAWFLVVLAAALAACTERRLPPMDGKLKSDLEIVAEKRIYFGHQSVGRDILTGVTELQQETNSRPLRIVDEPIGKNGDPAAKCASFQARLEKDAGKFDIALMKFCYADFKPETRELDVLAAYAAAVGEAKARNPKLVIVHVTAPLVSTPWGLKRVAKAVLGRSQVELNAKRSRFNEMLRRRYAADPVFDLAAVESTYPDGRRSSIGLLREYSSDGGHLSPLGRRIAARELLKTLAEIR